MLPDCQMLRWYWLYCVQNTAWATIGDSKQKLIGMIGYGPVELITISRPQAYLEYAPYHVAATEDEFILAVIKLYESATEQANLT